MSLFSTYREMDIKYYLNSDLFDLLENHLKLLIYRLSLNDSVTNVLFDEIYQSYPEMFEIVKRNLHKIEEYLEVEIQQNELLYRYVCDGNCRKQQPYAIKRTDSATHCMQLWQRHAQLIKVKLLSAFPQIDVISVDSSHVLQKIQPEDQDLIVTTVPLQFDQSPVVLVNPILTEQDIIRIQKVLYKIKPRHFIDQEYLLTKEEAMIEDFLPIIQKYLDAGEYQSFLGDLESFNQLNERLSTETQEINRLTAILTIDRIALDQQCDSWQAAVEKAGNLLLQDKLITQEYIDAMIQMVVSSILILSFHREWRFLMPNFPMGPKNRR